MLDPTRFSDPDRTNSSYYYCGTADNGGVHTNSGVPNKAYALMVDGGTFNGYTIAAVGIEAASAVQYRANEYKLVSSSKIYDNYLALLQSCNELYGGTSAICLNIKKATEAVKMYGPVCGAGGGATATPVGGGPTATPTPTRTPGPTTPTPIPGGQLVNGGFESGRNVGWSESSTRGYAIVTTGTSHAGSWRAWHGGANSETSEISRATECPAPAGRWSTGIASARRIPAATTTAMCAPTRPRSGPTTCARARHRQPGRKVRSAWRLTRGRPSPSASAPPPTSSLISSFYIDDVSVSAALQGVTDPNGMDGEQLTSPSRSRLRRWE